MSENDLDVLDAPAAETDVEPILPRMFPTKKRSEILMERELLKELKANREDNQQQPNSSSR